MASYDFERIWRRINKKLDLKKFSKSKTDRDRFNAFKGALGEQTNLRNLLKMPSRNLKGLYNFGVGSKELELKKESERIKQKPFPTKKDRTILEQRDNFKTIRERLGESRQRMISRSKRIISKQKNIESVLDKAEKKGFSVRGIPIKESPLGRPATIEGKLEGVTVSSYTLNGVKVFVAYKKGRRGAIARINAVK